MALCLRDVEQESEKELTEGIFGKICAVKYAGKSFAAQRFRAEYRDDLKQSLLQVCHVWSKVRHPNIVQFIGVWRCESGNSFPEIVTEKMQVSLRSFMDCHEGVSKINLLSVINDVSLGLWYLHIQRPPIVHCGIVPDNVLLQFSSCGHSCLQAAKITNVGVAEVMTVSDRSLSGQRKSTYLSFIPPEEGKKDNPQHEPSFDIFAFGSLIWYTVTQSDLPEHPQISEDSVTVEQQLRELQNNLNVTPEDCKKFRSLVGDCWKEVPSERPAIAQVSKSIQKVIDSQNVQINEVS